EKLPLLWAVWPSFTTTEARSRDTAGVTLATVTSIELTLLGASSESLTWMLTVLVAGPSEKVTSKLPAPLAGLKLRPDRVPTEPPLGLPTTMLKLSAPGSLVVKV